MLTELDENDMALVAAAETVIARNFDDQKYHYTVGAAVRARGGAVYLGVNVDGIHGACAEYIAIGAAATAGEREFECVVAVYGKEAPFNVLPPCGNCRQMLSEYAPDIWVILQVDGAYRKAQIRDLLPYALP